MSRFGFHAGGFLALLVAVGTSLGPCAALICDSQAITVSQLIRGQAGPGEHVLIDGKFRKSIWDDRFLIEVWAVTMFLLHRAFNANCSARSSVLGRCLLKGTYVSLIHVAMNEYAMLACLLLLHNVMLPRLQRATLSKYDSESVSPVVWDHTDEVPMYAN